MIEIFPQTQVSQLVWFCHKFRRHKLNEMVGLPRFELGSKRPKRPSIGQANPQTLPNHAQMFPFLNVTQEGGKSHHSAESVILDSQLPQQRFQHLLRYPCLAKHLQAYRDESHHQSLRF